jgi:F0F1-type ATP synthase delta subunit
MSTLLSLIQTTHRRRQFLDYLDRSVSVGVFDTKSLTDSFQELLLAGNLVDAHSLVPEKANLLKNELLTADIIKIVVPFVLSDAYVTKIYNILLPDANGLIEIEVSTRLIGGFTLYKDGVIHDFSLESQVRDFFEKDETKLKIRSLI